MEPQENFTRYFLGADLGGTKTHLALADQAGCILGFSQGGPGNHQVVGYETMYSTLQQCLEAVLASSGVSPQSIAGAGFGIAGYDWPSQQPVMASVIGRLGLACPFHLVNDAVPGVVAEARDGWGVGLVSGTGCNCRGLDRDRQREGRVTGYGYHLGEFAGATELVWRAMQLVAAEWTRRGSPTALSAAMIQHMGAKNLSDLIEGYTTERYPIDPQAARLVFEVAHKGDRVARDLIRWAGVELGELANAVIRQLAFEAMEFDVVLSGGMFDGGPLLIEPLRETITGCAPRARLVRLSVPPVIGAVLIGMEQGGLEITPQIRRNLGESLQTWRRS